MQNLVVGRCRPPPHLLGANVNRLPRGDTIASLQQTDDRK